MGRKNWQNKRKRSSDDQRNVEAWDRPLVRRRRALARAQC